MTSGPGAVSRKEILAARARAIAKSREKPHVDSVAALTFRVGGERYALAVEDVAEVLDIQGLSPLLGAPSWLLGAIVAQSRLVPVIDVRLLLRLEGRRVVDLRRVVVAEAGAGLVGLAVEEIEGQIEVPRQGLARPPGGPFAWIAPDGLARLDVQRLLDEARPAER